MNYFTADLHLGNDFYLDGTYRPFKSGKEQDSVLLHNINEVCNVDDDLYVIGDFISYSKYDTKSWVNGFSQLSEIKPHVHLIFGNNESRLIQGEFENNLLKFEKYCKDIGFVQACSACYLTIRGKRFYLVHMPTDADPDVLNLFGHLHWTVGFLPCGLNTGVDVSHYKPLSEDDIFRRIGVVYAYYSKQDSYRQYLNRGFIRDNWK